MQSQKLTLKDAFSYNGQLKRLIQKGIEMLENEGHKFCTTRVVFSQRDEEVLPPTYTVEEAIDGIEFLIAEQDGLLKAINKTKSEVDRDIDASRTSDEHRTHLYEAINKICEKGITTEDVVCKTPAKHVVVGIKYRFYEVNKPELSRKVKEGMENLENNKLASIRASKTACVNFEPKIFPGINFEDFLLWRRTISEGG